MNPNHQNNTSKTNRLEGIESLGKLPPQAPELEEVILGIMMLEKEGLLLGMTEIPDKEVFYKDAHQHIYSAMKTLFEQGSPVDMLTIVEELRKQGRLEMCGGSYYISTLSQKISSSTNTHHHIKIIIEKWIAREIIQISSVLHRDGYEDTTDVFQLLEKASLDLLNINQKISSRKARSGKDVYRLALEKLASAMHTPGITGKSTGIPELDKITGGWQTPDLIIIAGRPGMGKTAFVISTTKNIFLEENLPVLIFSLEMTDVQLMERLIAAESEMSSAQLKKGYISEEEYNEIVRKTGRLYTNNLIIDDTPAITIGKLRAKAIAEKIKNPALALIIVDYLQLMKGTNKQNNREQEISEISASLKALAKELSVPVIALAQLSRGVETRGGNKKPQLSDLRESGAIEQDADEVIFIFRPEYYKIETYENGESTKGRADIIYAKNRHGPPAEVTIGFNGPLLEFHSILEAEPERIEKPGLFTMQNNFDNDFDNTEPF